MRPTAILLLLVLPTCALAGDGTLRFHQIEEPGTLATPAQPKVFDPGSGNSSPVSVVNFPLDEEGFLATAPVATSRVLDLLDQDVSIAPNEYWYSEVFSTSAFNSLAIQVSRLLPTSTGKCRIQWALTADDPFLMGEENKEPVYPYLTDVWVYSAFPADRTALQTVQAPLARVRCSALGGTDTAVISDVKVLLRRE